ncbi:PREDICTED: uncharacterized protein LOC108977060 [Bactrocera latifrons]|uniref:uncharacterized protein LOC108977060 n=1 Tax=Bactrocera latifrons TaxID=174628 RepID=UPI0008DE211F|nr:PREDICTED: uncharacterized protein LOC108977060 [Bactrocera latifrons]
MSVFDILDLRNYPRNSVDIPSTNCIEHFDVAEIVDNLNYFIKDNRAYTEDNVLVYNIFIYSIPKKFTQNYIQNYFSKFGKLLDVKIVVDRKSFQHEAPNMWFVHFAEPESACSVLIKFYHRFQGIRIGVKAANSWNQPHPERACSVLSYDSWFKPTIASIPTNGTNILSLNDDCLDIIFGMLELKNKVRFARVCDRFHDIFQIYCKREFKCFDVSNLHGLTLWEIRDFFRFAGGHIEELVGRLPFKNRLRIVKFITKYCAKLRLNLNDRKKRAECVKMLARYIQMVNN